MPRKQDPEKYDCLAVACAKIWDYCSGTGGLSTWESDVSPLFRLAGIERYGKTEMSLAERYRDDGNLNLYTKVMSNAYHHWVGG